MINLVAAAAVFVLFHLLVSGTRLRDAAVGTLGQGPYTGLYSLASIAGLTWLIFAFGSARHDPAAAVLWSGPPALRWVQLVLQFLALMLVVPGLATPNPTSVAQQGLLERPDAVKGMLRITRHPFLWGVAIWGFGHLLVNGDSAALVLFGSLLALALFGTVSIDAKRKRALGDTWDGFAAQTSNIPFAAIVAGRQSLNIGEIGWWRLALGVLVYAAVLFAHPYAFGVSPMP
ncbi:MAG TPA: NnrU family protein [Caulobacteraceae bacterium]|nr:NnrU family protein [Caulobacteraceae bacterium]